MDSVLIEKADWVFYYNFEDAEWELPNRQLYDTARQVKGCKLTDTNLESEKLLIQSGYSCIDLL